MDDMIGKNVYFKGYTSFKQELYPIQSKVVGKTENNCLLFIEHPNGFVKKFIVEDEEIEQMVIAVRKEDLEIVN